MGVGLFQETVTDQAGLFAVHVEVDVLPIPPTGSRSLPAGGLVIAPTVAASAGTALRLSDALQLNVSGGVDSSGGIRIELSPGGVHVVTSPNLGATLDASVGLVGSLPAPAPLLGSPTSSRVEVMQWHAAVKGVGTPPDVEIVLELGIDQGVLIIDLSEGDGFLTTILGGAPRSVNLASSVTWSSKRGIGFGGLPQLSIDLPVHQSIGGVLLLDTITLAAGPATAGTGAELSAALSGSVTLGPVTGSVKKMGFSIGVESRKGASQVGNLGDLQFDFGFKPPTGLGVVIQSAVATGGGFLVNDPAAGQYAGGVQLKFETISLAAVGLLQQSCPAVCPATR